MPQLRKIAHFPIILAPSAINQLQLHQAQKRIVPKIAVENQTDVMLEIAIGVSALNEKCRNTASCAKTIPAMGAWNPAAIAAATPQPINTSVPIALLPKT